MDDLTKRVSPGNANKARQRLDAVDKVPLALEMMLGEAKKEHLLQQATDLGFVNPEEVVAQSLKEYAAQLLQSDSF
jgi:hypothetical protein